MFRYFRQRQMSQVELSDKTGIPLRTIQAYECGTADINGANMKTIYKIALALGIPAYKVVSDPELIKLIKQERGVK